MLYQAKQSMESLHNQAICNQISSIYVTPKVFQYVLVILQQHNWLSQSPDSDSIDNMY